MTARSISPLSLRGAALCLVACLLAGLSLASTAQAASSNALNLCIERAGTHKGTVRLISAKAHCKSSERSATFLTASGSQGVLGAEAGSGATGARGAAGAPGAQGEKGPRGDQGLQGAQGPVGEKGPTGDKGPTGNKGAQGEPGNKGATGDKGPQGEPGDKGSN